MSEHIQLTRERSEVDPTRLRAERRALVEALEIAAEGLFACDERGDIFYRTESATSLLELSHVGGDTLGDVLALACKGQRNSCSIDLLSSPRRSLFISAIPIVTDDGDVEGALAVMQDTTEGRHNEALMRDFVANLSHELKTPVGALGLLAEALMIETDETVRSRLMHRMQVEAGRVTQVIDDILSLSTVEASMPSEKSMFAVAPIVQSAISNLKIAADDRQIQIVLRLDAEAVAFGREHDLVSAVQHLVENAVKYSPPGSSIEVSAVTNDTWTQVQIRDSGPGISAQYLDRIFERFFRIDDARTRSTGGTGLGLAIVRQVAQQFGGDVKVTSQEGEGSTFTLRLAARPTAFNERFVVEGGHDG